MTLLKDQKYYEGLMTFSEITLPVNNFFDKVLVMDKDEKVKFNRLALLDRIWAIALSVADFSKLT
jgi:glycyl-tRNA synthetase beta chain